MKTKETFLLLLICTVFNICNYSQTGTIDYFGQVPPGSTPKIFAPGIISQANRFDVMPVFSPNGKEFYFTVANPPDWSYSRIMVCEYENGVWTEPVIADFSGVAGSFDWGNCFSSDGNTIYFNSDRNTRDWEFNIWYIKRTVTGWSQPNLLSNTINAIGSEVASFVSSDSILYFRSEGGLFFAEKSENGYEAYSQMGLPINYDDEDGDENLTLSSDGKYMIFHTRRFTTEAKNELVISFKKDSNQWTNPKKFPVSINESGLVAGSITPDNKYYLYSHNNDIYWFELADIVDSLKKSNYLPYVLNAIPDQIETVGNLYNYAIPDTTFFDDDGNETFTLSVTLSNGNELPSDVLVFNPETNSISGTLDETGAYNIKVSATDTGGGSVYDIFRLTVESSTSINYTHANNELLIYPNPATFTIQINTEKLLSDMLGYEILDLSGKLIKQGVLESEILDVSDLNKGVYIISLKTDKGRISRKIVIE